ncbi:MAG TPA: c-type cytochrome [Flavobacterium sp.]|jgi:cytochrome c
MKIIITLITGILVISCGQKQEANSDNPSTELPAQTPEEHGKILFESRGNCFACHKPDQNVIAPSLVEIAKIYKEKNGNMVAFLQGKEQPIVDPDRFAVMKTNFSITKNMSEEELKAIEAYVYSFHQPAQ